MHVAEQQLLVEVPLVTVHLVRDGLVRDGVARPSAWDEAAMAKARCERQCYCQQRLASEEDGEKEQGPVGFTSGCCCYTSATKLIHNASVSPVAGAYYPLFV